VVQTKVEDAMGNLPSYGEEAVFVDAVDGQVEESAQVEGVAERRPFDQWEDVEGVAERRSFTQRDDIAVETVPLFYESMEFQDPVEGSAGGPTLIQQNFVTHNSCEINSTVINQAQLIEANIIMVAEARHEQKMRAAQAAYTAVVEESEAKVREAERCRQLVFQEASSRVGEIRSREEETSRRNKELASCVGESRSREEETSRRFRELEDKMLTMEAAAAAAERKLEAVERKHEVQLQEATQAAYSRGRAECLETSTTANNSVRAGPERGSEIFLSPRHSPITLGPPEVPGDTNGGYLPPFRSDGQPGGYSKSFLGNLGRNWFGGGPTLKLGESESSPQLPAGGEPWAGKEGGTT